MKKHQLFHENHGLSPLQKCQLQGVTRGYMGLHDVTKDYRNFILIRTFPDTFFWSILHKNSKLKKSQIFDQDDGLTPLEKF